MKKPVFILFASAIVFLTACGPAAEEKKAEDTQVKADSAKEQKNLDSLFNAANKNADAAKDSSMEKK